MKSNIANSTLKIMIEPVEKSKEKRFVTVIFLLFTL